MGEVSVRGRGGLAVTGLALAVFCLLLTFYDPALPAADLDSSWALASEYALNHGLVFGRDFVFTFGPYNQLATRFFDPATYPLVIAYDVFCVVAVFWTAILNRSVAAFFGLTFCFLVLRLPSDGLAPLALFGVFLICLQKQAFWPLLFVLLAGPLLLSKLSFVLVLAPLVLLADAERLASRRAPYLSVALIAALLGAYVAVGQPASAFPAFAANTLEVILGYGRAMQIPGDRTELVATLAAASLSTALLAVGAVARWRTAAPRDYRPVAVLLGYLWLLFAAFKMGFVRQDTHTMIFHMVAPAGLAMAFGSLDVPSTRRPWSTALIWLAILLMLASSFYWRSVSISRFSTDSAVRPVHRDGADLPQDVRRVFLRLGPRLETGLKWATGRGFEPMAERRRQAQARLVRSFPASVTGTVDAIPWDIAPLIASGLAYSPRPVPQSYSAYTPGLQKLDAAHFAGPKAPQTLILRVEDIDRRLPTLALGPSLPVIGERYDAVGRDPLGVVLRLRSAPRVKSVSSVPARAAPLGSWVPVPGAPGRLVMARIEVEGTLAGRLVGFLFREPVMAITLRTAAGREATYRFVPDMAELGAAVSPLPMEWLQSAPVLLDPNWSTFGEPVTAVRVAADKGAWAFRGARIGFDVVSLAPGFGANLTPLTPKV